MVRLISKDVDLRELLNQIGSDPASYGIFLDKDSHLRVWIDEVYYPAASVIKQSVFPVGLMPLSINMSSLERLKNLRCSCWQMCGSSNA